MITRGPRKRLLIGCWVLTALLLLGLNGFKLMSFLNPELPGYSRVVKEVREKWQRLESSVSLTMDGALDHSKLGVLFAKSMPVSHKPKKKTPNQKPQPIKEKKIRTKLPDLTGIIWISSANGHTRSLAVIDGKYRGEGETVLGFRVHEISEEGVTFTRGGASWFVPAPKVRFSLDQGG